MLPAWIVGRYCHFVFVMRKKRRKKIQKPLSRNTEKITLYFTYVYFVLVSLYNNTSFGNGQIQDTQYSSRLLGLFSEKKKTVMTRIILTKLSIVTLIIPTTAMPSTKR